MKLYGFHRSSAAFRVRIALNLKGLDYEQVAIYLRKGEQRAPDFLKLNPQGLVPALIDGDTVLTQSLATIEYLDEKFPNLPLLPNTIEGRARVRALAQIPACEIHPLGNLRVLQYLAKELQQPEPVVQAWFNHWIKLGFEAFEALIAGHRETGKFCHGDQPTLADICLVPQVFNAKRYDLDLKPYPTLMRIFEHCMTVPAFDRAQPSKQPDAE
jgi:maleylacetoacetate isomerase/maleylpyruvate isomerase